MDKKLDSKAGHWLFTSIRQQHPDAVLPEGVSLSSDSSQAWSQLQSILHLNVMDIAQCVADTFNIQVGNFKDFQPVHGTLVPERFCRKTGILPLCHDGESYVIATADPRLTQDQKEQINFILQQSFRLVVLPPDDIDTGLTRLFAESTNLHSQKKQIDLLTSDPSDNQTVQLVKAILRTAVEKRASDIHIHPFVGGGAIRFRVDGLLQRIATTPMETLQNLSRYLKAQAGLDPNPFIAQDGRLRLKYAERFIDVRLSILPVYDGDRIVCRLLEQGRNFSLQDSGFATADYHALRHLIGHGTGIVLLTGPTGSGKTSTLYALLSELNKVDVNIMTLENPVEYILPGISQVQVNEAQGLSFADSLKSILRQDPDVVLVGEIRDAETARIAAQAALTGHMVLSTLHTNDALGTIPRLLDLGLESSILADALVGVVSQRLVRKLCDQCKQPTIEPYMPSEKEFQRIVDEAPGYRPVGCEACDYTGYRGRLPIVEYLEVSAPMREALLAGTRSTQDLATVNKDHLRSISLSATQWIVSGKTTPLEVQRVLGIKFWNELAIEHQTHLTNIATYLEQATQGESGLKILMLTTNEAFAKSLQQALSYQIQQVNNEIQAADCLEKDTAIIALVIDSVLLESTPQDWLECLRNKLAWSGLPVLLLVHQVDTTLITILKKYQANYVDTDQHSVEQIAVKLNRLLQNQWTQEMSEEDSNND